MKSALKNALLPLEFPLGLGGQLPAGDVRLPLDNCARERVETLIGAVERTRAQLATLTALLKDEIGQIGGDRVIAHD
jgi:hypothetical protein